MKIEVGKRLQRHSWRGIMGEPGWENCICRWDLGMGPDLNCPVHGKPELQRGDRDEDS